MAQCIKIRVKHRKLCAGDLDRRIEIKCRSIEEPTDDSTDFTNSFVISKRPWSAMRTTKGKDMFFATNLDVGVTHIFYTRYSKELTADNWIGFRGQNFDIIEVENIDERDEWNASYCNIRGCETSGINNG